MSILEDAKRVQIDERTKGEAYSEGREVAKYEKQQGSMKRWLRRSAASLKNAGIDRSQR
ncbi:hypothetical protein FOQG_03634 [Fusarium oxysporum f. sp. raphani 54005]|uniref:Uncharacterized protein n=7 Tax=Fusarium oxysporum TaxID=5507 RepID=W9I2A4_FUSOX|nr:hypothetical protein FOXG_20060 [Fusarium oxysporum f. sp. lycopersici 4287]EWY86621.1 hypothetical protein FOYG_11085 [Fusarium oxysporum NRRL 32931]EWZ35073.1 hypothetical protein FOZG_12805 [Fusarium oxysporum Fo47]EWZ94838.1 hypothetical protein FOWG_04983 [Fusarium oxysporum f. sp. lycopersici MN25]EXA39034.1 hypothetical protein FOVG_10730 [Fusarium oxysporum f. sp. pisi HDV247]EXK37716.1 hypothetical protein FOMG_08339 [Fusarium oxysporum f. sp. melonis 26406]EXK94810.1 hypothetical